MREVDGHSTFIFVIGPHLHKGGCDHPQTKREKEEKNKQEVVDRLHLHKGGWVQLTITREGGNSITSNMV